MYLLIIDKKLKKIIDVTYNNLGLIVYWPMNTIDMLEIIDDTLHETLLGLLIIGTGGLSLILLPPQRRCPNSFLGEFILGMYYVED